MPVEVRQLSADDLSQMLELLDLFSDVFDDPESYARKRPRAGYLQQLLASDTFIAVVATQDDLLVGGLAAYELRKFEQERSEIYIYDLAVRPTHRRQRIATRIDRGTAPHCRVAQSLGYLRSGRHRHRRPASRRALHQTRGSRRRAAL